MDKIRVSQFMPFDSLKGFREALKEREKQVVSKVESSPDLEEELNQKILELEVGMMASVCFYDKDNYYTVTGMVSKIDYENKYLAIVKKKIKFESLRSLFTM